VAQKSRITLG